MIGFLLYQLVMARSGETHTVWETINPVFLRAFFATTILLLILVFSKSEPVKYRLLFVVMYSILARSFSTIIFPAGGIGPQGGEGLSITRLMFDSTIHDGWLPWPPNNIQVLLFNWLRGENFQAVISILFARTLAIDVFWTHVWLSPILWGAFVPLLIFEFARILGANEITSVLASLLITAFPHTILWGTLSVPNSVGYIFFLLTLLFLTEYLLSNRVKVLLMVAIFFVASVFAHLLTGIMSISLLILAIALNAYESEKKEAPVMAKISLASAFLLSTILLPLALLLQRVVSPQFTSFSLSHLTGLPLTKILGLFIIGEFANYNIEVIPIFLAGPALGCIGIIYMLRRSRKATNNQHANSGLLLISFAYLLVLIDYRILKLFMTSLPFDPERMIVFEYLLVAPFVAFAINAICTNLCEGGRKRPSRRAKLVPTSAHIAGNRVRARTVVVYGLMTVVLAAWLTGSIYYAYPHYSFLQITDYEIEAARYIEKNTNASYIVISDQWFAYAGGMFVGVNNTRAFYFSNAKRLGYELFNALREDPSIVTMNKTVAQLKREGLSFKVIYFVANKLRLGEAEFNSLVTKAQENNLSVYRTFGDGKLYIFYYET